MLLFGIHGFCLPCFGLELMGLGLTFVKAVVEAHDGKVSVRSPVKDGRGTEFEVLLQKMS